jgi:aryl-alcohol dehydrogenase-like predicted oxidoreductase
MEQRLLGDTGIRVSSYCLGAMMFGSMGNPDHDECVRMTHRALDAGINFIDTADRYSMGESEEILAKALKGRRDDVVLATKFQGPMGEDPNRQGGSRRWVVRAVEESLRRLDTDWIDLYQHHRPDWGTDLEETLGALTDLVHQGKVRAIGTSNYPADRLVEARWVADRRHLERVRCEQPPYSIFVRSKETAVLPTCRKYGIGVIVWSPLNGGWLADKYRRDAPPEPGTRAARRFVGGRRWSSDNPGVQRKFDLVDELRSLADGAGIRMSHLAHAFTLEHPAVTAAIIGPRLPEQLEDALAGADVRLDADVLDRIDELCPPGTDVDDHDLFFQSPNLAPDARRRPR